MSECEDCHASGRFGSCEDLFHVLLALDHQRQPPWGPHHGVNVACYYLQHPSTAPTNSADGQWTLIEAYSRGGLKAANQIERHRVTQNRRGFLTTDGASRAPARMRTPRFTIEDLSVDGSFPAQGYEGRMNQWVSSVVCERALQ